MCLGVPNKLDGECMYLKSVSNLGTCQCRCQDEDLNVNVNENEWDLMDSISTNPPSDRTVLNV